MSSPPPFGRVSARDRERRSGAWDARFVALMLFPCLCLVVVLYEFLYLQQFAAGDAADAASLQQPVGARLRSDQEQLARPAVVATTVAPLSSTIVNGRRTIVLVANYRDSKRWGVRICSSAVWGRRWWG